MKKKAIHKKRTRRKKKGNFKLIFCLILLAVLAVVVLYKYHYRPRGTEINKKDHPVTGIDISKHNGDIDWDAIKAQEIDFIFIKATEGENYADPTYRDNLKSALDADIPVGAYHFFSFDKDGDKQALNFLKNCQVHELTLPLVIDVEEGDRFTAKPNKSVALKNLKQMIHSIEKITNQKVIIYANEHTYQKYIEENFPTNKLWISSFNDPPRVKCRWIFWQYTHKGKIEGIDHLVDINTFWGNREDWYKYLDELEEQD